MDKNALLYLLTIAVYLGAAGALVLAEFRNRPATRFLGLAIAGAGLALHAIVLAGAVDAPGGRDANFINLLSATALLIILTLLITAIWTRAGEACMIALPAAALAVLLQWAVPIDPLFIGSLTPAIRLHIFSSLLAYSLLSIAAINAVMLAAQDYALRHPRLYRRIEFLPPLAVIEHLMFRLITLGWLLLTLSLVSGLVFVDDLFAQHLVHKTSLSILSWLLFGLLLLGRWRLGWRGRRAVRWTLAAMVVLALAYFGSKLVLEVVLDRSWQIPEGG